MYLDRGAFQTRLRGVRNAFPARYKSEVIRALTSAIAFVVENQNMSSVIPGVSTAVQPTRWYLLNYPLQQK